VQRFVPPGEANVVDQILAWLAGEGPGDAELAAQAVRRFQQLSAPIAAKAVEDTAFYRYGRLLSRNDVGFDAGTFASSIEDFHEAAKGRAERFPRGMLATATHDHKRGEDVRARLAVLSEMPDLWRARVERWQALAAPFAEAVEGADQYMLFQTLFGAWPEGLEPNDADGLRSFAERVNDWQQKSLREGKLRSSWELPDEEYEARCNRLTEALLDPSRSSTFLSDMTDFLAHTAAPARANTLAQVALHYTAPGVPDLYQGTELLDLSLVDPDNRRPVDYATRERLLGNLGSAGAAGEKLALIARLLDLRRQHPALFADGDYRPLAVTGERAGHVLAFQRSAGDATLLCVVALHCAEALGGSESIATSPQWWGDTAVELPPHAGLDPHVAALLRDGPVFAHVID